MYRFHGWMYGWISRLVLDAETRLGELLEPLANPTASRAGRRNLNNAQRIDVVDRLFGLKEKHDAEKRTTIT